MFSPLLEVVINLNKRDTTTVHVDDPGHDIGLYSSVTHVVTMSNHNILKTEFIHH